MTGERELAKAPPLDLEPPHETPPAGEPDPAVVKTAAPGADLARTTRKVKCTVALPPDTLAEIAAMARGLDRTLSWTVTQAYVIARPRLA